MTQVFLTQMAKHMLSAIGDGVCNLSSETDGRRQLPN